MDNLAIYDVQYYVPNLLIRKIDLKNIAGTFSVILQTAFICFLILFGQMY